MVSQFKTKIHRRIEIAEKRKIFYQRRGHIGQVDRQEKIKAGKNKKEERKYCNHYFLLSFIANKSQTALKMIKISNVKKAIKFILPLF